MGLGLAVVTNQSAVGRGLIKEEGLNEIHRRLVEILNSEGVQLDGLYYCPHKPDDQCWCRKPRTGLIERAADELSFDLAETFVVGDKASDIEMGRRAGAVTFLVRTGYGAEAAGDPAAAPDHVVADLAEAAEKIAALLDDRR
jgi:D-glycero-D-manno-heptose 1,7-bisphosphate phosphatase